MHSSPRYDLHDDKLSHVMPACVTVGATVPGTRSYPQLDPPISTSYVVTCTINCRERIRKLMLRDVNPVLPDLV